MPKNVDATIPENVVTPIACRLTAAAPVANTMGSIPSMNV